MPPKHSKPVVGGQKKGKGKKKIVPTRIRPAGVDENFIVVWLDSNIQLSDKDYQNSIKQPRCIVNIIKTFTDSNECQTFLNQIKDEKFFFDHLRFSWSRISLFFILEYHSQAKTDLVDYCRNQYSDNQKELKIIDEFNKTYSSSLAIHWYTRECFAYHMLNKALRSLDIEIILKMGFFLRDLHQQIKQLYVQQHLGDTLVVYRG